MTAEVLAATEHLVLRRMTNDDDAALAAYRSDPVQARYQLWETPYPLDSARGAHRPDAQRTIRPAYGSGSESRPADGSSATSRSASMATRPARPPSGSPSPLTRKATGTPPKHYAQSYHCCSPSTTYTASAPTATPVTTARSHCSNASARAARLTTTSQPGGKVNGPTSTSTPSSPKNGQTRTTEQTHNRRPKPEVETASWHLTSKLTNQPTSGAPVSPFLAWMCSHEERPNFLPESFYVVVVPWFGRPAK